MCDYRATIATVQVVAKTSPGREKLSSTSCYLLQYAHTHQLALHYSLIDIVNDVVGDNY